MLIRLAILAVILFIGAISALPVETVQAADADGRSRCCSLELQGAIHQPDTPGFRYLERISAQLKCAGPALWTAANTSILGNFEARFGVNVVVFDAFGFVIYPSEGSDLANMLSVTARANTNFGGFARDVASEELYYEFLLRDAFGQVKYILISLPAASAPMFKK